jgi:hypothetical protein
MNHFRDELQSANDARILEKKNSYEMDCVEKYSQISMVQKYSPERKEFGSNILLGLNMTLENITQSIIIIIIIIINSIIIIICCINISFWLKL